MASAELTAYTPGRSPIFEELNVAWASHELISDTTDSMLDWFERAANSKTA